jgi:hypothetical protein
MGISEDLFVYKIGKNGYDFGNSGYQNATGVIATPFAAVQEEASGPAADFRKSILIYFGQLQLKKNMLETAMSAKTDLGNAGRKIKEIESAVEKGKNQGWGENSDPMPTIGSQVNKALETAKTGNPKIDGAISLAITEVMARLPDILKAMFAELSKLGIPVIKDLKKAGQEIYKGVANCITLWKQRGIESVLRDGAPTVIVGKLIEQLKIDTLCAFGEATYSLAVGIAKALTGGAAGAITGVIGAIKGFLQFIWVKFKQYREYFALKSFLAECKNQIKYNFPRAKNKHSFISWFSPWVSELPIIASHCIASRGTGNYVGFMTALKSDGTDQSMSELVRGYSKFAALKKPAIKYAKSYYHDLKSDQMWVQDSLTIIEKGGLDTSNGEAAKSIGWFNRALMKVGFKKNVNYA